jgi:tRNA threonylcarbamoyladenosine biosynthesis protein TsaB
MIILALDTCLAACSVAILDGERVLAARSEPMARGHQERLAPLAAELMIEAALPFSALARIGATLGPGSFTGLRVGIAFAKGLGAALSVPVVGVGVLEALAAGEEGVTFAVMDAKRGQLYLQAFDGGKPLMAPDALDLPTAAARLVELAGGRPATLVGPGAALLAGILADARLLALDHPDPVAVARLAAARSPVPPRPLYLRAPDAKLPGGRDLPSDGARLMGPA